MAGIHETFGKYHLTERLAFGGMAEVFLASIHGAAGFVKPVVIKRLHPRLSEDSDFVQMLIDEARITAQLIHGNICQVLDLGAVDGSYYIAMEFISGEDLRTLQDSALRRRMELPAPAALYIMSEVLAGLDYAHRKEGPDGKPLGIVHRDISPQNILVSYEGEVKIIDFGIAKAAQRLVQTQAGVIKGKFRYMSPEQASGELIDHRSDVFAAGVVLYELLRGSPHSLDLSDTEVLRRMRRAEFDPLPRVRPSIPTELDAIVRKALARRARDRYQSAAEFRDAILRFLIERQVTYSRTELAAQMRAFFDEERRRKRSGSMPGASVRGRGATGPEPQRERTDVMPVEEPGRAKAWVEFAPTTESADPEAEIPTRAGSAVELSLTDAFDVASQPRAGARQGGLPDTEETNSVFPQRRPRREDPNSFSPPREAVAAAAARREAGRHSARAAPRYEDADSSVPTIAMPPRLGPEAHAETHEVTAPSAARAELHREATNLIEGRALHQQPTGRFERDESRPLADLPTISGGSTRGFAAAEPDFFAQRGATTVGEGTVSRPPPGRSTTLRTAIGAAIVAVLGAGLALALYLLDKPLSPPPPPPDWGAGATRATRDARGAARPAGADGARASHAQLGLLRIHSKPPGARLVLCGVPTEQRTPAEVQAEVGRPCTIELELEGHQRYRSEVTPRAGAPLTIVATLRRARTGDGAGGRSSLPRGSAGLLVTSIQVGTVYVDGKAVGRTPRLQISLAPGEYSVRVHFPTLDVMTAARKVTLRAGRVASEHFNAEP